MISGCFICTNEEKNINEFIDNIKPIVNEMVFVDGGSIDNTSKLIKQKGGLVFEHSFEDFSSQRNYALNQAKYEWIFTIDLDQRISPKFYNLLPSLLEKNHECYLVKSLHYRSDDGKLIDQGWKPVLHKNHAVYYMDVHEKMLGIKDIVKIYSKNVVVNEYKSEKEQYLKFIHYKDFIKKMYAKYRKLGLKPMCNYIRGPLVEKNNRWIDMWLQNESYRQESYITQDLFE